MDNNNNDFIPQEPQASYIPPQQPVYTGPQMDEISFGKVFGLSLITCGIYGLIYYAKRADDINFLTARYNEKPLMNFWLVYLLLSGLTCGILPLVWMHQFCTRIGEEADRRGVNAAGFGASTFWIWGVLLSFTCVGPIVFLYKLTEATNALARDYNVRGLDYMNPGYSQF